MGERNFLHSRYFSFSANDIHQQVIKRAFVVEIHWGIIRVGRNSNWIISAVNGFIKIRGGKLRRN